MRVSARGFAIFLWIVAVFVFVERWATYLVNGQTGNGWLLLGILAGNLASVGSLAGLGAMVYLLGEIRDQFTRRQ
jgi:hypothetical protein